MEQEELPRERLILFGAGALASRELLAILLRTGIKGKGVLELADEVLEKIGGLEGVGKMEPETILEIRGIGRDKAIIICAAMELGRRLSERKVRKSYEDFSLPRAVAEYVMDRLRDERQEHFQVAMLDVKNRLLGISNIASGGLSEVYVEVRQVFQEAMKKNAASIILLHNHPSGESSPSVEDKRLTERMVEAGKLMGIPVLDHIIVGDGEYVSFREWGLMGKSST